MEVKESQIQSERIVAHVEDAIEDAIRDKIVSKIGPTLVDYHNEDCESDEEKEAVILAIERLGSKYPSLIQFVGKIHNTSH